MGGTPLKSDLSGAISKRSPKSFLTKACRLSSMMFLHVFQKLLVIAESFLTDVTAVNLSSFYLMNPFHVIPESKDSFAVEIAQPTFAGSLIAVGSKINKN